MPAWERYRGTGREIRGYVRLIAEILDEPAPRRFRNRAVRIAAAFGRAKNAKDRVRTRRADPLGAFEIFADSLIAHEPADKEEFDLVFFRGVFEIGKPVEIDARARHADDLRFRRESVRDRVPRDRLVLAEDPARPAYPGTVERARDRRERPARVERDAESGNRREIGYLERPARASAVDVRLNRERKNGVGPNAPKRLFIEQIELGVPNRIHTARIDRRRKDRRARRIEIFRAKIFLEREKDLVPTRKKSRDELPFEIVKDPRLIDRYEDLHIRSPKSARDAKRPNPHGYIVFLLTAQSSETESGGFDFPSALSRTNETQRRVFPTPLPYQTAHKDEAFSISVFSRSYLGKNLGVYAFFLNKNLPTVASVVNYSC